MAGLPVSVCEKYVFGAIFKLYAYGCAGEGATCQLNVGSYCCNGVAAGVRLPHRHERTMGVWRAAAPYYIRRLRHIVMYAGGPGGQALLPVGFHKPGAHVISSAFGHLPIGPPAVFIFYERLR